MTATPPEPASDLDHLHTRAEAEAQRLFGNGPVAAWDAAPARARARVGRATWLAAGAALLLGVATLVSVGSRAEAPTALPEPVAGEPDAAAEDDSNPSTTAPATRDPVPSPAAREVITLTTLTKLTIARSGKLWKIDAVGASRLEAADRLARLSGTELPSAASLLHRSAPLDLHWQGRDLADAWRAVIGNELNYALRCSGQRCRIWLLGGSGAPADAPESDAGEPADAALPRPSDPAQEADHG